jgi:hypothetical protein
VTKHREVGQRAHPSEDQRQLEHPQQGAHEDDAKKCRPTRDQACVLAQIVQT